MSDKSLWTVTVVGDRREMLLAAGENKYYRDQVLSALRMEDDDPDSDVAARFTLDSLEMLQELLDKYANDRFEVGLWATYEDANQAVEIGIERDRAGQNTGREIAELRRGNDHAALRCAANMAQQLLMDALNKQEQD